MWPVRTPWVVDLPRWPTEALSCVIGGWRNLSAIRSARDSEVDVALGFALFLLSLACEVEEPHPESVLAIQAADWIAALMGRLGAIWAKEEEFPENLVFRRHFEHRINRLSRRSGIRN